MVLKSSPGCFGQRTRKFRRARPDAQANNSEFPNNSRQPTAGLWPTFLITVPAAASRYSRTWLKGEGCVGGVPNTCDSVSPLLTVADATSKPKPATSQRPQKRRSRCKSWSAVLSTIEAERGAARARDFDLAAGLVSVATLRVPAPKASGALDPRSVTTQKRSRAVTGALPSAAAPDLPTDYLLFVSAG